MCSAGLIDCDVHISDDDDDEQEGKVWGHTCRSHCSVIPALPVQQMDTHREKAGWISPGAQGYSNADLAVHVVE